jgi:hypothetical protein
MARPRLCRCLIQTCYDITHHKPTDEPTDDIAEPTVSEGCWQDNLGLACRKNPRHLKSLPPTANIDTRSCVVKSVCTPPALLGRAFHIAIKDTPHWLLYCASIHSAGYCRWRGADLFTAAYIMIHVQILQSALALGCVEEWKKGINAVRRDLESGVNGHRERPPLPSYSVMPNGITWSRTLQSTLKILEQVERHNR